MRTFNQLTLLLMVGLTACTPLEDSELVNAEQKLYLTASKSELTANGFDRTYLTARVPEGVGVIDVTFTTTAGLFDYSASKTVKEYSDSLSGDYRYATTSLRTDTTTGPIYVTAEFSTVRQRIKLTFIR